MWEHVPWVLRNKLKRAFAKESTQNKPCCRIVQTALKVSDAECDCFILGLPGHQLEIPACRETALESVHLWARDLGL